MAFVHFNFLSELPPKSQLAKIILSKINRGELVLGQSLPSVSELVKEVYKDKDAILDAFNILAENKVIEQTRGRVYVIKKSL